MRAARVALVLAALLVAPVAHAESRRYGSVEIGTGQYRPDIDSQPGLLAPLPYGDILGGKRNWGLRFGISYALLKNVGTLEAGIRTGFFRASGNGLELNTDGTISAIKSIDATSLNIIPSSLILTYRFDLLADRYNIPLAPYARVAFERYNWWVSGDGRPTKYGATNGWSATAGLALQLDFFDRTAARDLDRETGINHTYVFADFTKSTVDDFGSSKSWDLSDTESLALQFGLLFVF